MKTILYIYTHTYMYIYVVRLIDCSINHIIVWPKDIFFFFLTKIELKKTRKNKNYENPFYY